MAANDLRALTDARIAAYWVNFFGCAPEQLTTPGTHVFPHAGLADYRGVYLFRCGDTCVVSTPPSLLMTVTVHFAGLTAAESFDVTRLRRIFGDAIERIVGPAWQGYTWVDAFTPAPHEGVRRLSGDDEPALQRLAAACAGQDWEHSGIGGPGQVVFGAFAGETLVAAGMGEPRGATLLHIGIVTHPDYRGQGHGRAVVSAITAYGLTVGLIPWYQTLAANGPSIAVAHALGFSRYAETLAVRLSRPEI